MATDQTATVVAKWWELLQEGCADQGTVTADAGRGDCCCSLGGGEVGKDYLRDVGDDIAAAAIGIAWLIWCCDCWECTT